MLYVGLVMLSYGFNKYSRTRVLLAQLALLFQNADVSWTRDVQEKMGKLLEAYHKTVVAGRARFLSSAKLLTVPSPHEFDVHKGSDFFVLWCRYIVMRKLASIIKLYQDMYRNKPGTSLFSMQILDEKDRKEVASADHVSFYGQKSFSLFQ